MDLGLAGANVVIAGGTKGMGLRRGRVLRGRRRQRRGARPAAGGARRTRSRRCARSAAPTRWRSRPTCATRSRSSAAFATIAERWGGVVNTLVNAVGPVEVGMGTVEQVTDDEWIATFEIGAMSAVRCVRAVPARCCARPSGGAS